MDEHEEQADPDAVLEAESLTDYVADEIARALDAHRRAARGTVQRALPLGEALALFNLADQFGLIDAVRADLDRRLGVDAYLTFSEAMKGALLDRGPGAAAPGRPPGEQPARPGPQGGRARDARPGRAGPAGNRPAQGRGRPPGRDRGRG